MEKIEPITRYFALVSNFSTQREEFLIVVHSDTIWTEYPTPLLPSGCSEIWNKPSKVPKRDPIFWPQLLI
jgi:hypothetical protein